MGLNEKYGDSNMLLMEDMIRRIDGKNLDLDYLYEWQSLISSGVRLGRIKTR